MLLFFKKGELMTNIKGLAKLAGVSVTTVSRVLNNHPYVSEKKKQAVLEAIKMSNYHKNINAIHLIKGKTYLIGVVLPNSDHSYFSLLLKGIAKQAMKNNYKLVLFQTNHVESREIEALEMLKQKQIDSLIICSRTCNLSVINQYIHYGKIVMSENINTNDVSTTFVNQYKVFYKSLEYLYSKGHRRIGYCVARISGTSSYDRNLAYKDFIKEYNIPYISNYIFNNSAYLEDGENIIKQIKEMEEPPSALLVTSDQVAVGMMVYCQKQQITIPDKLAIMGFGNHPLTKMMNITTLTIPLEQMGNNLFLQAISKETSHQEATVKLIERGTV